MPYTPTAGISMNLILEVTLCVIHIILEKKLIVKKTQKSKIKIRNINKGIGSS